MSGLSSYLTIVAFLLFGMSPLLIVAMFHSIHALRRKVWKVA